MNIIVAHCRNRGIGVKNQLPWRLHADLKNFKELTIGNGNNAVIMGRNTWVSLPSEYKPLPKRENIVLTTKVDKPVIGIKNDKPILMPSLKETLKYCNERKFSQVWIMGGEFLYKTALNNVDIDNIYITRIDNDFNCDTFFPVVPSYFHLDSKTAWSEEKEIKYCFEKYIIKDTLEDPALYFDDKRGLIIGNNNV
jgi:dihydrofolate reductase|tara:strand:+ start:2261 stop:2845 length:585 start_codon:yes stop_codon:yes gene_type:complete